MRIKEKEQEFKLSREEIIKRFSNSERCFSPRQVLLEMWDEKKHKWNYVLSPCLPLNTTSLLPRNKEILLRVVYYYMMNTPKQEVRVSNPLSFTFFEDDTFKVLTSNTSPL